MKPLNELFAAGRLRAGDEPAFAEPWQAQAFALTHQLVEGGLFTWNEWTETFSETLRGPGAAEDASDYFERWVRALESLLVERGVADRGLVDDLTAAWRRAAEATPHGQPILLENDPER